MSINDFSANRKAYAGTFEFGASVEALENTEDPILVFFCDAYAVVRNFDGYGAVVVGCRANVNLGCDIWSLKFECVANEVLQ